MLRNKSLRQGKPQAAATLVAAYQRVKNLVANFRRNARAVVDNLQFNRHAIALFRKCHLPLNAGSKHHLGIGCSARLHGLHGIARNVEHSLDKFFAVAN